MLKKILKEKWMWIVYILLFGALTYERAYLFFWPNQPVYFYQQIIMLFSINQNILPVSYILTILSLILNLTTIIIMWFYITEKKIFSISFITLITLTRFISDLSAYSYEWNTIKAISFQSSSTAQLAAVNLILWLIPSYLAMGDYIVQKFKTMHARTSKKI